MNAVRLEAGRGALAEDGEGNRSGARNSCMAMNQNPGLVGGICREIENFGNLALCRVLSFFGDALNILEGGQKKARTCCGSNLLQDPAIGGRKSVVNETIWEKGAFRISESSESPHTVVLLMWKSRVCESAFHEIWSPAWRSQNAGRWHDSSLMTLTRSPGHISYLSKYIVTSPSRFSWCEDASTTSLSLCHRL